jgi:hypothetical protein
LGGIIVDGIQAYRNGVRTDSRERVTMCEPMERGLPRPGIGGAWAQLSVLCLGRAGLGWQKNGSSGVGYGLSCCLRILQMKHRVKDKSTEQRHEVASFLLFGPFGLWGSKSLTRGERQ